VAGGTFERYRQIRVADNLSDQATPTQISGALVNSATQEDLQYYYLSRLREVIFGNDPSHHWYEDFLSEGIFSLKDLSAAIGPVKVRTGIALVGPKDSRNRVFRTTPDYFVHDPTGTGKDIEVWHNGRRLICSAVPDPGQGDFVVEESGGVGTGFDTIVLLSFSPIASSVLVADYQVAPSSP
jgi:hypothetical protein